MTEQDPSVVAVQVSVVEPPTGTLEAAGVNEPMTGAGTTVTGAVFVVVPPGPVQLSEYVALEDRAAVVKLPLVPLTLLQAGSPVTGPVAAHEVACEAPLHAIVEVPPGAMDGGVADIVNDGGAQVAGVSAGASGHAVFGALPARRVLIVM